MTVEHTLSDKKGGLVHVCHDDVSEEWHWFSSCAISSSHAEHKPYINTSIGQLMRER
jgi:hypothetical protein